MRWHLHRRNMYIQIHYIILFFSKKLYFKDLRPFQPPPGPSQNQQQLYFKDLRPLQPAPGPSQDTRKGGVGVGGGKSLTPEVAVK